MTQVFARMTTGLLGLSAGLLARSLPIFAFAQSMTSIPAGMRAAPEPFTTDFSTANVGKPALLIFQRLFAAHTTLLREVRALRTCFIISVAIMRDLRMSTFLRSSTFIATRRLFRATRQGRLQHSSATMAANLIKDCLAA